MLIQLLRQRSAHAPSDLCKVVDHFRAKCVHEGHSARVPFHVLAVYTNGALLTGGAANGAGVVEVEANFGTGNVPGAKALAEALYKDAAPLLRLPAKI